MVTSWSKLSFIFFDSLQSLLGLSQCLQKAGRGRRGECVCKQRGEEGGADGTGTGAAKGSAIPTGAPCISRTSLNFIRTKAAVQSIMLGWRKTPGWEMKRRSELRSYKQTSANPTLAQEGGQKHRKVWDQNFTEETHDKWSWSDVCLCL